MFVSQQLTSNLKRVKQDELELDESPGFWLIFVVNLLLLIHHLYNYWQAAIFVPLINYGSK